MLSPAPDYRANPSRHCLIFAISSTLLIGLIWANIETRKIYEGERRSSIVGRAGTRDIFQGAKLSSEPPRTDLSYSSKVTSIDWAASLPILRNGSGVDCRACTTGVFDPASNSNSRDLVLGLGSLKAMSSHLFIESLRGVRSQARIVLLLTDTRETILHLHERLTFDPCDVTVISVGEIDEKYERDIARQLLFARFLTIYQKEFDRVLLMDFDKAIVQADPFVSYWDQNTFGISAMAASFGDAPDLESSISQIDSLYKVHSARGVYSKIRPMSDRIIYGSVPAVLTFYSAVFAHDDFKQGNFRASFAAYVNFIYATKGFELVGLSPRILQIGDDFCSVYKSVELKYGTDYQTQVPYVAISCDGERYQPSVIDINPDGSGVELDGSQACMYKPRPTRLHLYKHIGAYQRPRNWGQRRRR